MNSNQSQALSLSLTYTHTHSGAIGTTFAAGACTSASIRDKDDYLNAAIGGMMAGSIFGFKRRSHFYMLYTWSSTFCIVVYSFFIH